MISEVEQKELKQLIGHQYSVEVQELLESKSIRNRNGHPHSLEYIRMVFQGHRQNQDVEAAIWELAKQKKQYAAAILKQKEKLLNN
jgi:hypothetical protein